MGQQSRPTEIECIQFIPWSLQYFMLTSDINFLFFNSTSSKSSAMLCVVSLRVVYVSISSINRPENSRGFGLKLLISGIVVSPC